MTICVGLMTVMFTEINILSICTESRKLPHAAISAY
jgi:hypothetical protein